MLIGITVFFFIVSGCVVNPKYSDPKTISEEQAQKYPQDAEQIRQRQRDYDKQQNIQSSQASSKYSYSVSNEKISGWSVGNPNAVFHIGNNNYNYHHKINLTLVCDKNSFVPKPFGHKKIKWKISDSIFGDVQTSLNGDADIRFSTNTGDRFRKITIVTANSTYDVGLDGHLLLEVKQNECDRPDYR